MSTETDNTPISRVQEYAVWLAGSGIEDAAQEDMNEGMDPLSERGEELGEEDWRKATKLGHEMASAVRDNPEAFLAWFEAHRNQDEEQRG